MEKHQLYAALQQYLKRTPKAQFVATIQQAVTFKKLYAKAAKLTDKSKIDDLQSMLNEIRRYYGD